MFDGQYNYQNLHFEIDKRFYFSQLGYADVTGEVGHVFGQVPYPLLSIPHFKIRLMLTTTFIHTT